MLISYIHDGNCGYVNMHAEQAYKGYQNRRFLDEKYLDDLSLGIYSNELTESILNELQNFVYDLKEDRKNTIKQLILDFNNLEKIQHNLEKQLNECKDIIISLGIELIIINSNMTISQAFNDKNGFCNFLENRNCILGYTLNDINTLKIELEKNKKNFTKRTEELFDKNLRSMIKKCFIDGESSLESSPVITNKYINIKRCIESISFFPYCVYKLALNMINNNMISINPEENKDISLFCHTLNGAYISGLLTKLLCIDLTFFDHIGPKNKIYNTFLENRLNKNRKYIVVTDVICLKSELRAVKTLLDYERANYKGAVSIVYCNTVYDSKDEYNICPLIEINKNNNINFNYIIKTDLLGESN